MAKNWAIAIGINEYDYLQPLNYAKRDAELMQEFLEKEAGFNQVFFFSDDSPKIGSQSTRPTRANLRRILLELFQKPFMDAGDNFWFFFSGHGMRYAERDYLMPSDGNPADIEETAIPINFVTERLRGCGADNVVLILDACRNLGTRGEGIGRQTAEEARQQGVISIFSCSPQEYSYEIDALKQGAFTTALLEGFRCQHTTVVGLDQYLNLRVPEIVRQHKQARQTPYIIAEPVSKSHLILVPRYAKDADIAILKNDAFRAQVKRELDLAKQLWMRVLAATSGQDSEAIEALEEIALLRNSSAKPHVPQPPQQPISSKSATNTPVSTPPAKPVAPLAIKWSRRKVIQTVGFAGAGLGLTIVVPRIFSQNDTPQTTVTPISEPLPSANPTPSQPSANPTPSQKLSLKTFQFETVTVDARGKITYRPNEEAKYFAEDLGNGVTLEMVQIPEGTFIMGSPQGEKDRESDEGPQHEVTVPGFFMGRYEVTQAQYQAIMGKNPSNFKGENSPVERVSWDDAVEFCKKLSDKTRRTYRLPSEAEWEYACRAGTTTPFYFGEIITPDLVNYDGNYPYGAAPKGQYRQQTTNVGIFPPNSFGLYDMCGNIWEWCQDVYNDSYRGAPTDGSAWLTGSNNNIRLLRGGSWSSDAWICRSANRVWFARENRDDDVGFRVVVVAVV